MDNFKETAIFFEQAENTLHDISQKVCCGSDVPARQYISELKDCLARIRVLKEEALHTIHCFDDDHGLQSVISSCNDVMKLCNQLAVKTEQYLKHFSTTTVSDDAVAEISRNSSETADSNIDSDEDWKDESVEHVTVHHNDRTDTEPTVDKDSALGHCDSADTAASSSPQLPTLAEFGITKETLDRLALLRLTVEPQNSHTSVPQRHAEALLVNGGTHQQQIKTETASSVVGQAQSVDGSVHSHTHVASERPAVGRVPLQSCGNTHCDMFTSPEVPAPVLSSVAQQCLRSGFKPN